MGGNLFSGGSTGSADKFTGGSKQAQKSNKANLQSIKDLFSSLNLYGDKKYDEALASVSGVGTASKNEALSRENQQVASATQGLQGLGLSGSTVGMNVQRGIHSDTLRTLGTINEDVARMRAGLLTGQAGFRANSTFNLGSILSGVQYKPGANNAAELAKLAAMIFG